MRATPRSRRCLSQPRLAVRPSRSARPLICGHAAACAGLRSGRTRPRRRRISSNARNAKCAAERSRPPKQRASRRGGVSDALARKTGRCESNRRVLLAGRVDTTFSESRAPLSWRREDAHHFQARRRQLMLSTAACATNVEGIASRSHARTAKRYRDDTTTVQGVSTTMPDPKRWSRCKSG